MRITKWGEYGILSCLYLAQKTAGENKPVPVGASDIAGALSIPLEYAQQILQRLRKGEIIASTRGPSGGYLLSRNAENINLKDILFATEGFTFEVICETHPLYESCSDADNRCGLHHIWQDLRKTVDAFLEKKSLASLALESNGQAVLVRIGGPGALQKSESSPLSDQ